MPRPIAIDVISDTICPWCYIGKRRLERAVAMRPEIDVAVRWHPFQLDATIPRGGIARSVYLVERDVALAQRLGITGVPCFVLDNRFAVMGAQPSETIADAIHEAATSTDDPAV